MSDLENQVENTEEVSSIVEEPTKGAEKGDKSAHKQGSSSEEKIESGKAEVVKPEENPVDRAVAAARKQRMVQNQYQTMLIKVQRKETAKQRKLKKMKILMQKTQSLRKVLLKWNLSRLQSTV